MPTAVRNADDVRYVCEQQYALPEAASRLDSGSSNAVVIASGVLIKCVVARRGSLVGVCQPTNLLHFHSIQYFRYSRPSGGYRASREQKGLIDC